MPYVHENYIEYYLKDSFNNANEMAISTTKPLVNLAHD